MTRHHITGPPWLAVSLDDVEQAARGELERLRETLEVAEYERRGRARRLERERRRRRWVPYALIIGATLGLLFVFGLERAYGLEKGLQQETSSTAYCDKIADTGARWARLMVQPELYAGRRDSYIATVKRCKARGLKVMVSLMHWYQTSPRLSAGELAFAAAVAARDLGPWVDAWSPINEPNVGAFAVDWKPYLTATSRVAHVTAHRAVSYKRVRRGAYKRVYRRGAWRYRNVRHHRGHWRKTVRRWTTTAYSTELVPVHLDIALARASCTAYNAAAAQIRRLDPTALLVFGDTAWSDGSFMKLMLSACPGAPDADVVGIHYSLPDQDARDVAKRLDAPLWVTEWGNVAFKQGDVGATLRAQQAAGVKVSIYYNGLAWNHQWRDQRFTTRNLAAFKAF